MKGWSVAVWTATRCTHNAAGADGKRVADVRAAGAVRCGNAKRVREQYSVNKTLVAPEIIERIRHVSGQNAAPAACNKHTSEQDDLNKGARSVLSQFKTTTENKDEAHS
jgi:hypothetical protein